ncbi:serine protease easter-like [Phlebotomus argentipes]|uniref:serine protease easter-like n=1 Tax=Phlebotomus argentipes TaxID=94469 RepID=UPI002892B759|nr:serine protease easter-like [Phlebotomus argentipes]
MCNISAAPQFMNFFFHTASGRVTYRCSGSVISDRYIVTAAHCVRNLIDDLQVVMVRLGELDTRSDIDCDPQTSRCTQAQDFEIERIIPHSGYDSPKYANDIALIRLRRRTNSSFISPLCLPSGQYADVLQNEGTRAIIAGWGSMTAASNTPSPMLQWVRLPIVGNTGCAEAYQRFSANSRTPIIVSQSQMCVQGRENMDACQGDSGGPLMSEGIPGSERYILLGLVSFGPRTCGVSNFPGVYTRISSYIDWIMENIQHFPPNSIMSVQINYLCALIILCANLVNADYTTTYGQCYMPDGSTGVCVNLHECKHLYEILTSKRPLTEDDKQYLRERQCGFFSGTVGVCCEVEVSSNSGFSNNDLLPDPNSGQCGIDTSNRIYGGEVTKIDEYPWMVLLRYKKPGNRFGFHCGGVLINNRYVMTASHCVNGRDIPADWTLYQVRVGEHDTGKDPDCDPDNDCAPSPKDIIIEQRIPHPQYVPSSRNQRNDIALLRLAQTVQFNDFVKPVCLPTASYLRNDNFVGKSMDVAGWGKTESVSASNVKLKVRVNGVSQDSCNSIYSRQNVVIGQGQLCAGGEKGKDSCRGDSGGPLVALDNKAARPYWFCVGLVSFGPSPCGLEGWPGVYTRVSEYIDWISQTVRA